MFSVGELVWILSSDESGNIMPNRAPVLILKRYEGVPQAFPFNEKANEDFVGTAHRIIYDIFCDGIVEYAIDEDWLKALTADEMLFIMNSE
jgi:hypothetical protein